ncbi:MAG: sigma factor-like helix-turn-helix DNA-binding protein, partial [Tepidisphaeraceae bacterium]
GRCIRNALRRVVRGTRRYRALIPVAWVPEMERPEERADREQETLEWLQDIITANPPGLSRREWTILHARFGLNHVPQASAMTLQQAGQLVGLAKERVRQVQNGALAKLRRVIDGELCRRCC